MTTARPNRNGSEPMASPSATIRPHSAMVSGFFRIARIDVTMAAAMPTLRSSSSGKDTALSANDASANRKPTGVAASRSGCGLAGVSNMRRGELGERDRPLVLAEVRHVEPVGDGQPDAEDRQRAAGRAPGSTRARASARCRRRASTRCRAPSRAGGSARRGRWRQTGRSARSPRAADRAVGTMS